MAHDLERGNRLELDWLNGKVAALGKQYGVPTPASDEVVAKLTGGEDGPPASTLILRSASEAGFAS